MKPSEREIRVEPLRLRAPAKINWTLEITGRRPDGFHELQTVMQCVSLWDELTVAPAARAACRIVCDTPGVPRGPSNLIHRAWRLLRAEFRGRVGGIDVELVKRIPAGAGLGGGSSDAAAALLAIDRLFGLRLGRAGLAGRAAALGSDVPFFVHGGAARCRGRGEVVEPLDDSLAPIPLVVVFPGFVTSTAEAYGRLTARDLRPARAAPAAVRAIERGDREALLAAARNTFDRLLTPADPRLGALQREMIGAGLQGVMLSGSGSACFGWARDGASARRAAGWLATRHGAVFRVRTLKRGMRWRRPGGLARE